MITVRAVLRTDDLRQIVTDINGAEWDDANEMAKYDIDSLTAYLERQDTLFVICHDNSTTPAKLLGIASSSIQMKPYGRKLWLYVDEVDVCADQRRKGVGTAMMTRLLEVARDKGCDEVWLGADASNTSANALYLSLKPDQVTPVTGYTYETDFPKLS